MKHTELQISREGVTFQLRVWFGADDLQDVCVFIFCPFSFPLPAICKYRFNLDLQYIFSYNCGDLKYGVTSTHLDSILSSSPWLQTWKVVIAKQLEAAEKPIGYEPWPQLKLSGPMRKESNTSPSLWKQKLQGDAGTILKSLSEPIFWSYILQTFLCSLYHCGVTKHCLATNVWPDCALKWWNH